MVNVGADRLEKLLCRSKSYMAMFRHNKDDPAFMRSFNKHFSEVRALGYDVTVQYIGRDEYIMQLQNHNSVTRPEMVYTGPDRNR